jgi:hypothetical protein
VISATPKRGRILKARRRPPTPRAQERLLHEILGVLQRAEHPVAVHPELATMALDQRAEGGLVALPLPYRWDVRGDSVTITVSYPPLDATFTGSWREDGTFSGGWRPNPGADETVNVPYDIGGQLVS